MKLKAYIKKNKLKKVRQHSLQVKTNELEQRLCIKKREESDIVIALAGNPNVGKSTVFNYFTGLNQHTGNWPGKTVANAQGYCNFEGKGYVFVDIPGCYSLMAHSAEEEVARDFICFEEPDAVIVVCDATCLERNLNLVLQILEVTEQVVVCVNLMDEARKKEITIDLDELESRLGVPVVGTAARSKEGLDKILVRLNDLLEERKSNNPPTGFRLKDVIDKVQYGVSEVIYSQDTESEVEHRQDVDSEETYAPEAESDVLYRQDIDSKMIILQDTESEVEHRQDVDSEETYAPEAESDMSYRQDIDSKVINLPDVESDVEYQQDVDSEEIYRQKADSKMLYEKVAESKMRYPLYIESLLDEIEPFVSKAFPEYPNKRWLSARLLDADESLLKSLYSYIEINEEEYERLKELLSNKEQDLENGLRTNQEKRLEHGLRTKKQLNDDMAASFVKIAEEISRACIHFKSKEYSKRDRRLDRLFTSKITGFPIMFLVLLGIFWLTITGANYPSKLLSSGLFWVEDRLLDFFIWINAPKLLYEMLILGVYRVLAWVVSVMLPPMAIFFPLFTLLEDFGFLPRVAFNLDRCFKRCSACGKQALTMMMGFGCNAAGVVGCRIIDSPRERLIAIITNNFVPCNGRFPTLIAIISMFFVGTAFGWYSSILSAAILSFVIVLGIVMTLLVSKLLSKTILKGIPSSFTLELPPYRRPQIGKVIVRSIFDRTLFVLSRAVVIAMPAGLVIWGMANIKIADASLLYYCSDFLDPFGRFLGMDGVIILAFILGFPANEIVLPIIIMTYLAKGSLLEIDDLDVLRKLLMDNGWNAVTAISTMLFSLMHWPCSTTCLTIRKETQSKKWTLVSFVTPTIIGIIVCALFANIARIFL